MEHQYVYAVHWSRLGQGGDIRVTSVDGPLDERAVLTRARVLWRAANPGASDARFTLATGDAAADA